jgi:hypothetical protein
MKQNEFKKSLRERRMSVTKLAHLAVVGRSHLAQVLENRPGRGLYTRRRLFPHLTAKEVMLLGWGDEYARWLKSAPRST